MKELINSAGSASTDVLARGAPGVRARGTPGASVMVTVPAGRAAAPSTRAVDHARRPELTRSPAALVNTTALWWER
jgi:hypothetical protein